MAALVEWQGARKERVDLLKQEVKLVFPFKKSLRVSQREGRRMPQCPS